MPTLDWLRSLPGDWWDDWPMNAEAIDILEAGQDSRVGQSCRQRVPGYAVT